jgi:hypothetical protein
MRHLLLTLLLVAVVGCGPDKKPEDQPTSPASNQAPDIPKTDGADVSVNATLLSIKTQLDELQQKIDGLPNGFTAVPVPRPNEEVRTFVAFTFSGGEGRARIGEVIKAANVLAATNGDINSAQISEELRPEIFRWLTEHPKAKFGDQQISSYDLIALAIVKQFKDNQLWNTSIVTDEDRSRVASSNADERNRVMDETILNAVVRALRATY